MRWRLPDAASLAVIGASGFLLAAVARACAAIAG